MRKRKLLSIIIGFVLVFAFVSNAMAFSYDATSINRAYVFGSLSKNAGQSTTKVTCSSVSYARALASGKTGNFHYARPQAADGTLFASSKTVTVGSPRTFNLNTSGTNATLVKVKVYNADYVDSNNTIEDNTMEVHGSVTLN